VLFDPICLNRGLFRPDAIENLVAEHLDGKREHSFRLWALLMLELWFRTHLDAPASRPDLGKIPTRGNRDETMPVT
jgi:asparagine synthase (glutamine-hydrolysing)